MTTLLLVDDEPSILTTLSLLLRQAGYCVLTASNITSAKRELSLNAVDVVITDMRLKGENGVDIITFLRETKNPAESIIITAYGSIESAVECVRLGAFDYLTKPVKPQELLTRLDKVLSNRSPAGPMGTQGQLHAEARLRGQGEIVARSPEMREILDVIHRIRDNEMPVLITGDTGTGKEVVAQAIHGSSPRRTKPLMAVNCCTLPEELLDSELFGHVKGAFSGAVANSKGLLQQAHQGTLFLDEIGDISPRLQAKLLRALQEGQVRPVGGSSLVDVDVRVIAATNRDLEAMMRTGEFRSDLFFRLNVVPLHLPPLRDRPDDLEPLIERVLQELTERTGRAINLSPKAWEKLLWYDYPGNVRQLKNILERTVALTKGPIVEADDIHMERTPGHTQTNSLAEEPVVANERLQGENTLALEDIAVRHIRRVLSLYHGNQVAAAKALAISRSTLRRRLGFD